ncbi:unnamed protein product [Phytophthora fragariaefolia]|uniref:Unnamed protein product n=1 Tax=Phytophthora fragariaefolia TaxID=1490495 RepID=A0A9W7DB97_9STRA|nr:unnamed protein product [Phytophthora fragariaefolia]
MYLQKRDMNIASAARLVDQVLKEFTEMELGGCDEDDEASFGAIWNRSVRFCESITADGGEPIAPNKKDEWRRRGLRSRRKGRPGIPDADASNDCPRITQEEYYRSEVYNKILNDIIRELHLRFGSGMIRLMELCGSVSPRGNFCRWNEKHIKTIAADYYAIDFEGSLDNLESEAKCFGSMAKRIDDFSQLATTEDLCATMIQHDMDRTYPMLYRLVCLVCVLPVASAGVERSFSAMKQDKIRLRTTLGDAWLSNLLLLTLESDLTKTID